MNTLPTPDQPDQYTGVLAGRTIRWITTTATPRGFITHLYPTIGRGLSSRPARATYCTQHNPEHFIDLNGHKLSVRDSPFNGFTTVNHKGITAGYVRKMVHPPRYARSQPTWCQECLSLFIVETEMGRQRAYPIRTLIGELERLSKQQPQKHP